MLSKFEETLPILPGDPAQRLGVCAMGSVAEGDELTFMRVWVWQKVDDKVAASFGTSGEHPVGGHEPAVSEVLPFTPEHGWMILTTLEPGAEQFTPGKPALAMAMALVRHSDESRPVEEWDKDIEHWSQAVSISG